MYYEYYLNTASGKLLRISSPSDSPTEKEWVVIPEDRFYLLNAVATEGYNILETIIRVSRYYFGEDVVERAVRNGLK